jgi:hypothetical protein
MRHAAGEGFLRPLRFACIQRRAGRAADAPHRSALTLYKNGLSLRGAGTEWSRSGSSLQQAVLHAVTPAELLTHDLLRSFQGEAALGTLCPRAPSTWCSQEDRS